MGRLIRRAGLVASIVALHTAAAAARTPTFPHALGNPADWFPIDAYPPLDRILGYQGRVVVQVAVDETGKPVSCKVTMSSSHTSLDEATCKLAMQNGHFTPAQDRRGTPIASHWTAPVRWQLNDDVAGKAVFDKPGDARTCHLEEEGQRVTMRGLACWQLAGFYIEAGGDPQKPFTLNGPFPSSMLDKAAQPVTKGNPGDWFPQSAYPKAERSAGIQGRVIVMLAVGRDGVPTKCTVTNSSKSEALDKVTCDLAIQSARFVPGHDDAGKPMPSHPVLPVRWQLDGAEDEPDPSAPPPPLPPGGTIG